MTKSLCCLLVLFWSTTVAAYPLDDLQEAKQISRKQMRIAMTLLAIERVQQVELTLPLPCQFLSIGGILLLQSIKGVK
jgi:hypothetical protein